MVTGQARKKFRKYNVHDRSQILKYGQEIDLFAHTNGKEIDFVAHKQTGEGKGHSHLQTRNEHAPTPKFSQKIDIAHKYRQKIDKVTQT
jgi:hypothetical protein